MIYMRNVHMHESTRYCFDNEIMGRNQLELLHQSDKARINLTKRDIDAFGMMLMLLRARSSPSHPVNHLRICRVTVRDRATIVIERSRANPAHIVRAHGVAE